LCALHKLSAASELAAACDLNRAAYWEMWPRRLCNSIAVGILPSIQSALAVFGGSVTLNGRKAGAQFKGAAQECNWPLDEFAGYLNSKKQ
jgi:hypothetical protein